MAKTDFIELYGLKNIQEKVKLKLEKLNKKSSKLELLNAALEIKTNFRKYDIHKKEKNDLIEFSSDSWEDFSKNILLLSTPNKSRWFAKRKNIVVALHYHPHEEGIEIVYIQSTTKIKLKEYKSIQEDIGGVRPHELLAAQLISRVAPILNMYPEMNIKFPYRKTEAQRIVIERFARKETEYVYLLNPKKERVKQIFGEGSIWIEKNQNNQS